MNKNIADEVIAAIKWDTQYHGKGTADGLSAKEIADCYEVPVTTVYNITSGKVGPYVDPAPLPKGYLLPGEAESYYRFCRHLYKQYWPDAVIAAESVDRDVLVAKVKEEAAARSQAREEALEQARENSDYKEYERLRVLWSKSRTKASKPGLSKVEKRKLEEEAIGYAERANKALEAARAAGVTV